jgi:protein-L-isoaspartate(D-aspartate) O-methyltransferase
MSTHDEFAERRRLMVQHQLADRGVRDPRVLAAMGRVPRQEFVPAEALDQAYADRPLPIGKGQTISQPLIVGMMLEALELSGSERVLEIGTGSGYQAALLGELAADVISVEYVPELTERAQMLLERLGYDNVRVVQGDGSRGWPERAPYDAIIVAAGAPRVPPPLTTQLGQDGRLVIPVGDEWAQNLLRVRRRDGELSTEQLTGCAFVPLVGEHGWHGRSALRWD